MQLWIFKTKLQSFEKLLWQLNINFTNITHKNVINMAACQTYINTLALYCIKCGTWLALHWLFWKKIMFIIFKIMLRLNIKSMVVFFPIKRHLNFCNILQKPDIPHILYFTLVSEMQWLDQPFFGWVSEVWW